MFLLLLDNTATSMSVALLLCCMLLDTEMECSGSFRLLFIVFSGAAAGAAPSN